MQDKEWLFIGGPRDGETVPYNDFFYPEKEGYEAIHIKLGNVILQRMRGPFGQYLLIHKSIEIEVCQYVN